MDGQKSLRFHLNIFSPDFWHLFEVYWHEKYYFSIRLTFGCKSSPKLFDTLSEALCWILANNYNIPYLIHLLDDFLIVSPRHFLPATHLSTIQRVLSELSIPIASKKTEGPATSLEFLGISLNSVKFQTSLPKEKIIRISNVINNHTSATRISKCDLLSLLCPQNVAMRIVLPFISHLLSLASSGPGLNDLVTLNE